MVDFLSDIFIEKKINNSIERNALGCNLLKSRKVPSKMTSHNNKICKTKGKGERILWITVSLIENVNV